MTQDKKFTGILINTDDKTLISKAAKRDRRSISSFLITAGVERAQRILAQKEQEPICPV